MLICAVPGFSSWPLSSQQHVLSILLGSPSSIRERNTAEHTGSLLQPKGPQCAPSVCLFLTNWQTASSLPLPRQGHQLHNPWCWPWAEREGEGTNAGHGLCCAHHTCSWTAFPFGDLYCASLIGAKIRQRPFKHKKLHIQNDTKIFLSKQLCKQGDSHWAAGNTVCYLCTQNAKNLKSARVGECRADCICLTRTKHCHRQVKKKNTKSFWAVTESVEHSVRAVVLVTA